MTATATQVETINLLDTDDETDEKELIELLESDEEDDIVEVFCLSEEPEPVSSIISAAAPAANTQQQTRTQKRTKQKQKQQTVNLLKRHKKRLKLKQQQTQHEQQRHKQQQLLLQQQQKGRHIIILHVDGSYQKCKQKQFQMSAGIWGASGTPSFACILQGGKAESCRAELGSIYAAMHFLFTSGLQGLGREAQAAAEAEAVQVWIYSDCQPCLDMLRHSCQVKKKYKPLITAIKQLKAQLPFTVRIFKVQGHSKGSDAQAVGNSMADKLARKCDKHSTVCKLPH